MLILFRKWFQQGHRLPIKICNAMLIALVLNILFGLSFYYVESPHQDGLTLLDSIWWAMVTMTTVGYGDYFPVTTIGRFFIAYPCFIIGIGFIGFLFGVVVDSVLDGITKKKKGYATMKLSDHIVICHYPDEAKILKIVQELRATANNQHLQVVVIDPSLEEQPEAFRETNISFIKGCCSSEETLIRASALSAQSVLVLAQDVTSSASDAETFATGSVLKMLVEKMNATAADTPASEPKLILELVDRNNRELLEKVNADGIVATSGIVDHLLVQELCNPGLTDIFDQFISYQTGSEFYLMPTAQVGKSLNELKIASIQHQAEVQVLGLLRGTEAHFSPTIDMELEAEDRLIILAKNIENFHIFEKDLL